MCGIVGYIGKKNATPFLLEGLAALEYRGYDSAGIHVVSAGTVKRAGKVSELAKAIPKGFTGFCGIAHTRWATHGAPTERNAHPHSDSSGVISLVHNGIIENYAELKAAFLAKGVSFASDTDSEVLAELIGEEHATGRTLEAAVAAALGRVRGTYGILVASSREPEKLVAARLGSPLMLGIAKDGYYLASDAAPILPYTRTVIYMDDGERAIITKDGYRIIAGDTPVEKSVETLEWSIEAAKRSGHKHFMLKEMLEIPLVIKNALRGRLLADTANLGGLRDVLPRILKAKRIIITGCGSAYYAGLIGELLIEEWAGIPVEVEIASELRYRRFTMNPEEAVLIAVSQSGETLDTLEAVKEAKRRGMLVLGVVNVVGSTIARATDAGVYNHAGPEIGVASTKAFVSQLTVLALIALLLGRNSGLSAKEGKQIARELKRMPELAQEVLSTRSSIEKIAKKYCGVQDAFYLGRKWQCPIAYEGALKLKEISYVHAEGYGAGEMKHGPIALIEPGFLSIVLAPKDALYEKTKSNIQELRARGGPVIAVTTRGNERNIATLADDVMVVPDTHEALLPILTAIPLQLFAYAMARERALPIDQPRNLAKSVTVE
ncbi:MAG: glutamine--fructose-6-phosphate transaminase (isomerizing) [Minisyncoccia bacterium]